MIELSGKYTDDVRVMGLDESGIENITIDQIEEMADSIAFEDGKIRIMPDTHVGSGAVIGFTMPLGDRLVPNVVGVDIGCGMESQCLGSELPVQGETLDKLVRDRVPMGFGPDGLKAPERSYYHVKNDFPWDDVNETLRGFINSMDAEWVDNLREFHDSGGYDINYFKELCERAASMSGSFDVQTGIASVGTLGSGNHFIELGRSTETGKYWVTIHSGSRGLGNNVAQYWQQRAGKIRNADRVRSHFRNIKTSPPGEAEFTISNKELRQYLKFDVDDVSDEALLDWVQGGVGEDFVDYEALKEKYEASANPEYIDMISSALKGALNLIESGDDPMAYLEGSEAAGYLIDMVFCQRYAVENRRVMAESVADALEAEPSDRIVATHNYIDFRDGIIRKGSTRAYEGERAVVPFNMKDGTLIVEGKSNPEWNFSAPHGAGRVMSRRQAHDEFTEEDLRAEMAEVGAFATAFPVDESPGAYKNADLIEEAIKETAEIVDRLEVVHNWKADD